jgi:hypothetical protein
MTEEKHCDVEEGFQPEGPPLVWADVKDNSVTEELQKMILYTPDRFIQLLENFDYFVMGGKDPEGNCKWKYYSYLTDVVMTVSRKTPDEYDYSTFVTNADILTQQISSLFISRKRFNAFQESVGLGDLETFNNICQGELARTSPSFEDLETCNNISQGELALASPSFDDVGTCNNISQGELALTSPFFYDLETCKRKVREYVAEDPELKKDVLDLTTVCHRLCKIDPFFPPAGVWTDYYGVQDLSTMISLTNQRNAISQGM